MLAAAYEIHNLDFIALGNRRAIAMLLYAFPWIAAVLVCLKISAAVWIAIRLFDRRLLRGRALLIGALSWDLAVFALYWLLLTGEGKAPGIGRTLRIVP